jgi:hypothetical protein
MLHDYRRISIFRQHPVDRDHSALLGSMVAIESNDSRSITVVAYIDPNHLDITDNSKAVHSTHRNGALIAHVDNKLTWQ